MRVLRQVRVLGAVAELPLPLMAAVGMMMASAASTWVWMLAKPPDLIVTPAGSFLTAIVTAAEPSVLVLTAVTVPGVPRPPNLPWPNPPWSDGAPLWPPWPNGAPLWPPWPNGAPL